MARKACFPTFYTQKTYEVQKHTISNHGHLAYAVIVNRQFWEGLPADIRSALAGAMKNKPLTLTLLQLRKTPDVRKNQG